MKKALIISALTTLCLTSACTARIDFEPEPLTDSSITVLTDSMSLEEKVGQMLFVRCPDAEDIDELMNIQPGGILMFGRDFEGLTKKEVKSKISELQKQSAIPLLIGADEEGGTVVRVSANPQLAPQKYPSPQQLYRSGGMEALTQNTTEKSQLLKELGININLAPVADVSQNPDDFMYSRSMGLDAETTAECIQTIVTAMKENNMLSCLKHFPGYGATADTHTQGAADNRSEQSFREITENTDGTKTGGDFLPFAAGIAAGADCVLVAHNSVEALDIENPASLSPQIHKILRTELGFNGVIMTDDIAMGAVSELDDVYIRAVNAGNDLLITTDYNTAFTQITEAVRSGKISEDTINTAVERILKMKKQIV